jgi:hypothetical protein
MSATIKKANVLWIRHTTNHADELEISLDESLANYFKKNLKGGIKTEPTKSFVTITHSINTPGGITAEFYICKREDYDYVPRSFPNIEILSEYTNKEVDDFIIDLNTLMQTNAKHIEDLSIDLDDDEGFDSDSNIEFTATIKVQKKNEPYRTYHLPRITTGWDTVAEFRLFHNLSKAGKNRALESLCEVARDVLVEMKTEIDEWCDENKIDHFLTPIGR